MYPVENSAFSIVIEDILTDLDRRVLTYLYLPIIGEKALSIYQTLFTMVNPLEKESSILSHSQVLNLLKLSAKTFTLERRTLEAVGLLSTYYKDGLFVYVLKNVLKPYEFFSNKETICNKLTSSKKYSGYNISYIREMFDYNIKLVWLNEKTLPQEIQDTMNEVEYHKYDLSYIKSNYKMLCKSQEQTQTIADIFNIIPF